MLYVFTVISASPSSQTAGKAGIPLQTGFPGGSDSKESACNAGDPGSIPESGRSPGEGNGHPLQYFCPKNSMDGGAWKDTVHGVRKEQDLTDRVTHTQQETPRTQPTLSPHHVQISDLGWFPLSPRTMHLKVKTRERNLLLLIPISLLPYRKTGGKK